MARYRPGIYAARELLDRFQLKVPIDVDLLVVEFLHVPLHVIPLPDRISGQLAFNGTQPSIIVNSRHPIARRRFTTAHEAMHLHCGHGPSLCMDKSDTWKERQANLGAAELLMPASTVTAHAYMYQFDIYRLAERYGVSQQAMEIRLRELGLIGGEKKRDKQPGEPLGLFVE